MFDIHLHILAGIDDGPADREESAAMLKLSASLGYERLVATPHLLEPLTDVYSDRISAELDWSRSAASNAGIELNSGFEVRLTPDLGRRLEQGEPITLAGSRTVLIELPFAGWPAFTDQAIFDVMSAGFRPLLAHPERYGAVMENPTLVHALHERGVLMQVTTGSLAGLFGRRSTDVAERLIRDGVVDVLASDAHSAGRRFVSVTEGLARAAEIVGPDRVRQLTRDNPLALISDQPLPPPSGGCPSDVAEPIWRVPLTRMRQLIPKR